MWQQGCGPCEQHALVFALSLDLDGEDLDGLLERREPLVQTRFDGRKVRRVRVLAEACGERAPQRAAQVERDADGENGTADDRKELEDITHDGSSCVDTMSGGVVHAAPRNTPTSRQQRRCPTSKLSCGRT
jgi:hypothetical protein